MAGKIGDSEQQRQIDRIMRVAFRIARDAGATFINLKIENRKIESNRKSKICSAHTHLVWRLFVRRVDNIQIIE